MVVLGFTQSMVWPAANALIGELWPGGGRRAFNMFYVVNNLGVAIGTAIGGVLAAISFLLVFVFNGISYLIYVAVFVFAMSKHRQQETVPVLQDLPAPDSVPAAKGDINVPITLPILFLSLGMIGAWTAYSQWVGPIAVYTDQEGYGLTAYSFLWTLNGLIIVAGQPLLTYLLKKYMSAISVQVMVGSFLYFLTFLLIAWHPNYTGLLLGMVIMTIGEMIILPGVPAAISQLAPKERMGFYQGIVASASTGGRMAGPVLGGLMYDSYGPVSLFGFGAGVCVVAMACFVGFYFTTRRYILK
jgi:MFS family permease